MSPSLFSFIVSSVIVTITPGLTVSLIIANTLRSGLKAGLLTVLGGITGIMSMLFLLVVGFDFLITRFSQLFEFIQLVGGIYLIYVGIQTIALKNITASESTTTVKRNVFMQGYLLMWSNPKTIIFLGAFIPPFVNKNENITYQLIVLGLVFSLIAFISDSAYAIFINIVQKILTQYKSFISVFSGISICFIGMYLLIFSILEFLSMYK